MARAPPQELGQAARILVLEEGPSPSGDYVLHPWLAGLGPPVLRLDARGAVPRGWCQPGDHLVVLRYLPPAWRRAVQAARAQLGGLAWFLDDDLLDRQALTELPRDYGRKLRQLGADQRGWFEAMGAQWLWATEALASKYPMLPGQVLPLAPPVALRPRREPMADEWVRVVYHGSASHARELAWLQPLLQTLQARCANTQLALIGDLAVNRRFRDLPRTTVLHPMSWPNYLAYTHSQRADIGLAPLFPGRFNAGRGAVKFYDYARMGAVGVYSDVAPYAGFVRPGCDGLLLPLDPGQWLDALIALASDPAARLALARQAWARACEVRGGGAATGSAPAPPAGS